MWLLPWVRLPGGALRASCWSDRRTKYSQQTSTVPRVQSTSTLYRMSFACMLFLGKYFTFNRFWSYQRVDVLGIVGFVQIFHAWKECKISNMNTSLLEPITATLALQVSEVVLSAVVALSSNFASRSWSDYLQLKPWPPGFQYKKRFDAARYQSLTLSKASGYCRKHILAGQASYTGCARDGAAAIGMYSVLSETHRLLYPGNVRSFFFVTDTLSVSSSKKWTQKALRFVRLISQTKVGTLGFWDWLTELYSFSCPCQRPEDTTLHSWHCFWVPSFCSSFVSMKYMYVFDGCPRELAKVSTQSRQEHRIIIFFFFFSCFVLFFAYSRSTRTILKGSLFLAFRPY